LEQYTVCFLRYVQLNILVKETFYRKRFWFGKSVRTALTLKRFQPFSSFGAALARGGGEQNPGLVAILRHSPARAEKFGEINFCGGISLFHGYPEKANRFADFRRSAGRAKYLQCLQVLLLARLGGIIGRRSWRRRTSNLG
jgi:hypothetical protein